MNFIVGAFKPPCNISIKFADGRTRKQVSMKKENGQTMMVPLFQSQENIVGEVLIEPVQGKKVEHNGVKIELLGQIELYFDRGNFYDFTSLVRELDVPGELYEKKTYPFEFSTVEMPYESYNGVNVRLRYILKVTVSRNYVSNIVEHQDFLVRNYTPVPSINNSIKMEVGIEDCLHIEFEYSKSKYHLKDVIIGKIYFLLVRIKIKNMELEIRRRESTGSGPNTYVETETLAKFELMDGAPVREFKWDDVKVDKHRENYVGHSVMAPVGRWQKGKDLLWYARDKKSALADAEAAREEIKRIKEQEEQAMREHLGLAPKRSNRPQGNRLDKHEYDELVKRGSVAEDMGATYAEAERVHGIGFSRTPRVDTEFASDPAGTHPGERPRPPAEEPSPAAPPQSMEAPPTETQESGQGREEECKGQRRKEEGKARETPLLRR